MKICGVAFSHLWMKIAWKITKQIITSEISLIFQLIMH